MLVKIKCPGCAAEGSISLLKPTYEGPYKCWKCRELYYVVLSNNEMQSCRPLEQEEFEKLQEIEDLKRKFRKD